MFNMKPSKFLRFCGSSVVTIPLVVVLLFGTSSKTPETSPAGRLNWRFLLLSMWCHIRWAKVPQMLCRHWVTPPGCLTLYSFEDEQLVWFFLFVHVSVYGVDSPRIVRLELEHFESAQFLTFTWVFLIVDEASACSTVCSVILSWTRNRLLPSNFWNVLAEAQKSKQSNNNRTIKKKMILRALNCVARAENPAEASMCVETHMDHIH